MTVTLVRPEAAAETAAVPSNKDPLTRLMDLTLGWGEYVEKDEAEHPDCVNSASVYDLYQSVAQFAEPYWDAPLDAQETAARQFLETRLLPLLLGKAKR